MLTRFVRPAFVWLLALGLLAGCSKAAATKRADGYETLVLRYQGYPSMVSPHELAQELGYLAPIKLEYVGGSISGPQNIQAAATGDVEFGGAFNGAVIKLIAAKAPVKAVISYYGTDEKFFSGFYALPDTPIRSAKDLLGKKIAVNTLGAHAEFTIREYLARGGLSADQARQVQLVVLPPSNAEQALREHQVDVAQLSTFLYDKALERGELRRLFTDHELFGSFNAGSLVMRTDFIEEHPNTVRKFIEATAKAVEWARNTPREQVIERLTSTMRKRNPSDDPSPLQHWHSMGIASPGGELRARDFQLWIDWLVKDGQLPAGAIRVRDLYTNQFQRRDAR